MLEQDNGFTIFFNNIISRRLTDKELININVKTPQNLIGSTALESPQV